MKNDLIYIVTTRQCQMIAKCIWVMDVQRYYCWYWCSIVRTYITIVTKGRIWKWISAWNTRHYYRDEANFQQWTSYELLV